MIKLNPSIKHHLYIGAFISFWIFLFAFFIRPFDDGTYDSRWIYISIGFSIIAFLSYSVLAILQKAVYQKISKWNISFEISALFFFHFLNLVATYIYYKSPILNGYYNFLEFLNIIILKSAIIITPILILSRIYLIKLIPAKENILIIKGEYKLDLLKIHKSDLVCITKSQNYVEVFFIQNGLLNSKLIRSSLKKVQEDFEFLIQVHRSHLINPAHFQSWKNQNTISLTHIEIPVSKNYKNCILTF